MSAKVALLLFVVGIYAFSSIDASISTAILKIGDSYLIREAENAQALVRDVRAGHQKMQFSGENRGRWVDKSGIPVVTPQFELFQNGSVLIKSFTLADAGTYQKEPNPMIRIGDMGYAPPILIIQADRKSESG